MGAVRIWIQGKGNKYPNVEPRGQFDRLSTLLIKEAVGSRFHAPASYASLMVATWGPTDQTLPP